MFDNTNPYTIRIEETNGQKRYFVAFIDGQGIFRESEVSYEVYTQFGLSTLWIVNTFSDKFF